MTRWLAPILSFTAEEIWQHLPGAAAVAESVFLSSWHEFAALPESAIDWEALIALRSAVQRELEKLRDAGGIGAPLEAQLSVYCLPELHSRYAALGDELRFLTITSAAQVISINVDALPEGAVPADTGNGLIEGVWLRVQRANESARKCVRCWHLREDVGSNAQHPELCARCAGNLLGLPETRQYA
jgi:isoleucyl-tRNA synthetase